jgi:hypothetical protein
MLPLPPPELEDPPQAIRRAKPRPANDRKDARQPSMFTSRTYAHRIGIRTAIMGPQEVLRNIKNVI